MNGSDICALVATIIFVVAAVWQKSLIAAGLAFLAFSFVVQALT